MKLAFAPLAVLLVAFQLSAAPPPVSVSRQNHASVSGSGNSFAPVFSGDGRSIVFVSQAKDLVSNGVASPFLDVFVRDLTAGRTMLVTANTNGLGGGDADSN